MKADQLTERSVGEFAGWLKEMMEERGASLRKVAEYAGVSSASLSDLAAGKVKPSYETCLRLAKYFVADPNTVLKLGGHEPIIAHPMVPIDFADPRLRLAFARVASLPPEDQRLIAEHVILPWLEQKERKSKKKNKG